MSYQQALSDLKEQFGSKRLLTPAEVATVLPRCVKTVRQIINSDKSPLPPKVVGKTVCVSIYDLARFLAPDEAESPKAIEATATSGKASGRARKPSKVELDPTKPYRRPPSLGKLIVGFQARIADLSLRLQFESELVAELERLSLAKKLRIKDAKRLPSRSQTQPF